MKQVIQDSQGKYIESLDAKPDFIWVSPSMDDKPEFMQMMEKNTN